MPEKCALSHGSGVLGRDPRDSCRFWSPHVENVCTVIQIRLGEGGGGGGIPLGGGGGGVGEPRTGIIYIYIYIYCGQKRRIPLRAGLALLGHGGRGTLRQGFDGALLARSGVWGLL